MEDATTLRVYWGPNEEQIAQEHHEVSKTITVSLMDMLPLLAEAFDSKRTWLRDFQDDEITISDDLYEMLMAYQHHWRPSA